MTIVTTVITASHRYYARKGKSDLISRVQDLEEAAGLTTGRKPYSELQASTRDQLATYAMQLHRILPE